MNRKDFPFAELLLEITCVCLIAALALGALVAAVYMRGFGSESVLR